MEIAQVLDLLQSKWRFQPLFLGGGGLGSLVLVWRVFRWTALLSDLGNKDLTIELLMKQLEIVDDYDEGCRLAAMIPHDGSGLRLKALMLHAGCPNALKTFLDLTNQKLMQLSFDPFEDQIRWGMLGELTKDGIEKLAALRFLRDLDYVAVYTESTDHYTEYCIFPTAAGQGVRRAYDQLPLTLKATIEVLAERLLSKEV